MPDTSPVQPIRFKTVWTFALISMMLVLGPFLLAWMLSPSGYVFSGALANHNDFSAYLAAMRQGAEGHWLFHFNYSPETWQPQLMLPIYMLAGKMKPAFLGYLEWLQAMRVLALSLTLFMYVAWARRVFPNQPAKQWTTWVLLVFGGGLGWLLWPLANAAGFSNSAMLFPDITDSGWTLGLTGGNAPHYMLGLFLETLFFWSFWRVTERAGWKWVGISALTAAALGLIYVYNTTVVLATVGLYLLWLAWQERRIPWRRWLEGGLILLSILPQLFYYGYWVNRDPVWARYVVTSPVPPPPPYTLLWGAGIVGVLAFIGIRGWWRTKQNPLPLFWIVGNLLVMYLPIVPFSGRFILGLWIPIATVAADSLEEIVLPWLRQQDWYIQFSHLTPTPYETLRRVILLLTVPSTLMVALFFVKSVSLQPDFPFYMPKTEIQAMQWLAKQTDSRADLVLAYYPAGNYFPALSDTRVFMGQFFMTVNFKEKLSQVEKFWQAGTSDEWRQALIKKWGVTYIYQGKYENALSRSTITPPGRLVYDQSGVKIYRVIP